MLPHCSHPPSSIVVALFLALAVMLVWMDKETCTMIHQTHSPQSPSPSSSLHVSCWLSWECPQHYYQCHCYYNDKSSWWRGVGEKWLSSHHYLHWLSWIHFHQHDNDNQLNHLHSLTIP